VRERHRQFGEVIGAEQHRKGFVETKPAQSTAMKSSACDNRSSQRPRRTIDMTPPLNHVLLVTCPDRPGLIHTITGVLLRHGVNVISNDEFVDRDLQQFVMRSEFVGGEDASALRQDVQAALPEASVVVSGFARPRIVVLASHEPHCLGELLLRQVNGELGATIQGVVSNRPALRRLTERFDIAFHCVPHGDLTREAHEEGLGRELDRFNPDYLVLAKYMRILSPGFVERYAGRIVNIHHSFLPAFAGANPYRQAFARGVKIIGATAHFVTAALDEGPIIAQDVVPVDHSYRANEMAQAGRDVEKIVLAKALKLLFENRVFVMGNRTIVFD
jgi:formyltetrahydrofolate deformylase